MDQMMWIRIAHTVGGTAACPSAGGVPGGGGWSVLVGQQSVLVGQLGGAVSAAARDSLDAFSVYCVGQLPCRFRAGAFPGYCPGSCSTAGRELACIELNQSKEYF